MVGAAAKQTSGVNLIALSTRLPTTDDVCVPTAATRPYAAELGYATVLWDVDPQDWRRPGTEAIADHVLSHIFSGAIVLMHDGGGDRTQSVAALEIILRELSAKGYIFYNIFGNRVSGFV